MRDVKTITCLAIIAIALVCISFLATAFELQVADANSKISCNAAQDPLPSWNDGYAKSAILNFVVNVTNTSNPDYVVPEERIATFDNDGTLWCEYPDPVPFRFILDRVKDMARDRPEWNNTEPFSSILSGKRVTMANFSDKEIMQIYVATSSNLTPEGYMSLTRDWLNRSKDPHFGRPYTKCVYKPMLELLSYLRTEGFKVYIVTGGDEDFVRAQQEGRLNALLKELPVDKELHCDNLITNMFVISQFRRNFAGFPNGAAPMNLGLFDDFLFG